ncbi:protein of unknown function (DUF4735) [Popillia japonica]|uniref:Uncharacterized protein n=1 Tax=Popillia japonica TaxID=7064 RepID=A0AAW1JHR9_POPJA
MRSLLLLIASLLSGSVFGDNRRDEVTVEIKEIVFSIENLLSFVEKYYYQMNLDGVLGITLAQAQLEQIIYLDTTTDYFAILTDIVERCQYLKHKIVPLLPDEPEKFRLYKDILLDSNFWYHRVHFGNGRLKDMGMYQNWTLEYILNNKEAVYNGIHTDVCLTEILKENYEIQAYKDCYISPLCLVVMLGHRTDTMYLLTHRLLYLQMARQTNCVMGDNVTEELIEQYCSLIWKEAKTNELLGFPQHDIFLEGVVLCGMEGFSEFMSSSWRRKIRNWQTGHGCYTPEDKNLDPLKKRTTNIIEFGCADHTTGLALAALSLNLRYIMTTDKAD